MNESVEYQKIVVSPKIYPVEAALGAGYLLADRLYTFLDIEEDSGKMAIYIKPKSEEEQQKKEEYKDIFLNQLLYEAEKIAVVKRNKKVREFIVGRALFSNVENLEEEEGDYEDDPLGISTPWEEKFDEDSGGSPKQDDNKEEGYDIAMPWEDNDGSNT